MKKLLFPILSVFILASCAHYESKVPISPPSESQINNELLGEWILSSEKRNPEILGTIDVFAFNEQEYLVQLKEVVDSTDFIQSIVNIRMFSSRIKNNTYLNLQFLGNESDNPYMIYRFKSMPGNRHKLFYLSKDLFKPKFSNSARFKEHIETNPKEFEKAFELEGVLVRKTNK